MDNEIGREIYQDLGMFSGWWQASAIGAVGGPAVIPGALVGQAVRTRVVTGRLKRLEQSGEIMDYAGKIAQELFTNPKISDVELAKKLNIRGQLGEDKIGLPTESLIKLYRSAMEPQIKKMYEAGLKNFPASLSPEKAVREAALEERRDLAVVAEGLSTEQVQALEKMRATTQPVATQTAPEKKPVASILQPPTAVPIKAAPTEAVAEASVEAPEAVVTPEVPVEVVAKKTTAEVRREALFKEVREWAKTVPVVLRKDLREKFKIGESLQNRVLRDLRDNKLIDLDKPHSGLTEFGLAQQKKVKKEEKGVVPSSTVTSSAKKVESTTTPTISKRPQLEGVERQRVSKVLAHLALHSKTVKDKIVPARIPNTNELREGFDKIESAKDILTPEQFKYYADRLFGDIPEKARFAAYIDLFEAAGTTFEDAHREVPEEVGDLKSQTIKLEKVEEPVTTEAKLPEQLKGAKPRYSDGAKAFQPIFESDIDLASYITAQTKRSKRDAEYLKFVMDNTGWSEAKVRAHGEEMKAQIKASAKDEVGGTQKKPQILKIGHVAKAEVRKPVKRAPAQAKISVARTPGKPVEAAVPRAEAKPALKGVGSRVSVVTGKGGIGNKQEGTIVSLLPRTANGVTRYKVKLDDGRTIIKQGSAIGLGRPPAVTPSKPAAPAAKPIDKVARATKILSKPGSTAQEGLGQLFKEGLISKEDRETVLVVVAERGEAEGLDVLKGMLEEPGQMTQGVLPTEGSPNPTQVESSPAPVATPQERLESLRRMTPPNMPLLLKAIKKPRSPVLGIEPLHANLIESVAHIQNALDKGYNLQEAMNQATDGFGIGLSKEWLYKKLYNGGMGKEKLADAMVLLVQEGKLSAPSAILLFEMLGKKDDLGLFYLNFRTDSPAKYGEDVPDETVRGKEAAEYYSPVYRAINLNPEIWSADPNHLSGQLAGNPDLVIPSESHSVLHELGHYMWYELLTKEERSYVRDYFRNLTVEQRGQILGYNDSSYLTANGRAHEFFAELVARRELTKTHKVQSPLTRLVGKVYAAIRKLARSLWKYSKTEIPKELDQVLEFLSTLGEHKVNGYVIYMTIDQDFTPMHKIVPRFELWNPRTGRPAYNKKHYVNIESLSEIKDIAWTLDPEGTDLPFGFAAVENPDLEHRVLAGGMSWTKEPVFAPPTQ
ncbi:hypothetical protein MUP59_02490, partial [Candidatus Bathyarchaeota archaeon]|nr:hypothetical protein [Candidatus Bathyarchaeota archaeon]